MEICDGLVWTEKPRKLPAENDRVRRRILAEYWRAQEVVLGTSCIYVKINSVCVRVFTSPATVRVRAWYNRLDAPVLTLDVTD